MTSLILNLQSTLQNNLLLTPAIHLHYKNMPPLNYMNKESKEVYYFNYHVFLLRSVFERFFYY